jgi:hypothetical protein
MRREIRASIAVALVLNAAGCSFSVAAFKGRADVRGGHEYADAFIGAAAGFGCALALVAWKSPDSYAPITDDPSSWESPQDRTDTRDAGRKWTPYACTATVAFFASGIYGHVVKSNDGSGGSQTTYEPPRYSASRPAPSYTPQPEEEQDEEVPSDGQVALCENGNQFSCRSVADSYATGRSMMSTKKNSINWRRAIEYYGKACEAGDEDSCMLLGREYRDGIHVDVDAQRAYKLFKKAYTRSWDKGCHDMRSLSGSVGRLKYSGADPELTWHCSSKSGCFSDPVTCEANGGSCRTERTAFCYVAQKGDGVYSACSAALPTCEARLKAATDQGLSKVTDCQERSPTVPGQFAGEGWYCTDGFGSAGCSRLLATCRPNYGSQQCNLQQSVACVVAFDIVKDRYVSKCYPTMESCKRDSYSIQMKDDYTERSGCFIAR